MGTRLDLRDVKTSTGRGDAVPKHPLKAGTSQNKTVTPRSRSGFEATRPHTSSSSGVQQGKGTSGGVAGAVNSSSRNVIFKSSSATATAGSAASATPAAGKQAASSSSTANRVSSSSGFGYNWRSREDRLAEEKKRSVVLSERRTSSSPRKSSNPTQFLPGGRSSFGNDVVMGGDNQVDSELTNIMGLLNNAANSASGGTSNITGEFNISVSPRSRQVAAGKNQSIEEQLIGALKAKVQMLENENKLLTTQGVSSTAGGHGVGGAHHGSSSATTTTTHSSSHHHHHAAGHSSSPAAPSADTFLKPGSWTPAHTEKLVVSLHSAETRAADLEAKLHELTQKHGRTSRELEEHAAELVTRKAKHEADVAEHRRVTTHLEQTHREQVSKTEKALEREQHLGTRLKTQGEEVHYLKQEGLQATRRITELQADVNLLSTGKERIETELQSQLAAKTAKMALLEQDAKEADIRDTHRLKELQKLDAYHKALLMPASESLLLKQLQELRREHNQSLTALQTRVTDIAELNDKCQRYEAHMKNLTAEIASLKQELQTKTELSQLLQQKNQVLELEGTERKQLGKQNEKLKAEMLVQQQNLQKQYELNDELSARLYSVYETVPAEALEAWLEPERRAKREAEAVAESYRDDCKRLTSEQATLSIEVAHLQTRLSTAQEQEQRLQKKVVEQTMQIEELLSLGGGGGAATSGET